jgi:ABC-type phosphate transport system substrate-binding protein
MNNFVQRIVFLLVLLKNVRTFDCGPTGSFRIAGSESVKRLAESWRARYTELCPNSTIEIEGEGSSAGAARVCGTRAFTSPVDIGGMSRDWDKVEATTVNGWLMDCERSQRSAIQVSVFSITCLLILKEYLMNLIYAKD